MDFFILADIERKVYVRLGVLLGVAKRLGKGEGEPIGTDILERGFSIATLPASR